MSLSDGRGGIILCRAKNCGEPAIQLSAQFCKYHMANKYVEVNGLASTNLGSDPDVTNPQRTSNQKLHDPTPTPDTKALREALKKDFRTLYVKEFTTDWEVQRLVREAEIDVMQLESLEQLITSKGEIFVPVRGYEGFYEVSNTGKVRSLRTAKELKPHLQTKGYPFVSLCVNGKKLTRTVHRIVAEAFISNPDNKPTVNHKDGNRLNNNSDNLEWATVSENSLHSYRVLGRMTANDLRRKPPRTHCRLGHVWTDDTTYLGGDGTRRCKQCIKVNGRSRLDRINTLKKQGG